MSHVIAWHKYFPELIFHSEAFWSRCSCWNLSLAPRYYKLSKIIQTLWCDCETPSVNGCCVRQNSFSRHANSLGHGNFSVIAIIGKWLFAPPSVSGRRCLSCVNSTDTHIGGRVNLTTWFRRRLHPQLSLGSGITCPMIASVRFATPSSTAILAVTIAGASIQRTFQVARNPVFESAVHIIFWRSQLMPSSYDGEINICLLLSREWRNAARLFHACRTTFLVVTNTAERLSSSSGLGVTNARGVSRD